MIDFRLLFLLFLFPFRCLLAQDIGEAKPYYTQRVLNSYHAAVPDTFEYLELSLGDSIWVYNRDDEHYFIYDDSGQYKHINLDLYSDVDSIYPFDFEEDGHVEYVLFTSHSSGRSGWQSGWGQREKDVLVIDAKKSMLLLSINVYEEYNYWENDVEYNEHDSLPYYEITGSTGTHECASKLVVISKEDRLIYIDPTDTTQCEDQNEYTDSMVDDSYREAEGFDEWPQKKPFRLRLTAAGFIREEID